MIHCRFNECSVDIHRVMAGTFGVLTPRNWSRTCERHSWLQ